jgi:hypothetical protein
VVTVLHALVGVVAGLLVLGVVEGVGRLWQRRRS